MKKDKMIKKSKSIFRGSVKALKKFWANPYFKILLIVDILLVSFMYIGPGNLINTHDGNYHLYRLSTSIAAFDDKQPFLQLDPNQIQGFGQAPNLFYGPMLSWLLLIIFKITHNLQFALMFLMFIASVATTFGTYFVAKRIFKNEKSAFFTALLFTLEPFHVGELLTRGSFSEYLAFAFVPFIILALYQIIFEGKTDFKRVFTLSFCAFGIILNHNLTAVLIALTSILFVVFGVKEIVKKPKILITLMVSGILTVCFSAIFLLPFLEVKQIGIYNIFNPEFGKWFYKTGGTVAPAGAFLATNAFHPPVGKASVIFGMSPVILIITFAFLVFCKDFRKTKVKKFLAVSVIICGLMILFASRVFENLSIINKFHDILQFSQRMLFVPAILLPFVAGFFLNEKLKNKREIFIATAVILISYVHIITVAVEPGKTSAPMNVGIDYNLIDSESIAMGEYQSVLPDKNGEPESVNFSLKGFRKIIKEKGQKADVVSGAAEISNFSKIGSKMNLTVKNNKDGAKIEFPMFYYPGFKAVLDGKPVKTTYSDKNRMVLVELEAGQNGNIGVYYGVSQMTKYGVILSGVSFAGCGAYYWLARKRENVKK